MNYQDWVLANEKFTKKIDKMSISKLEIELKNYRTKDANFYTMYISSRLAKLKRESLK